MNIGGSEFGQASIVEMGSINTMHLAETNYRIGLEHGESQFEGL